MRGKARSSLSSERRGIHLAGWRPSLPFRASRGGRWPAGMPPLSREHRPLHHRRRPVETKEYPSRWIVDRPTLRLTEPLRIPGSVSTLVIDGHVDHVARNPLLGFWPRPEGCRRSTSRIAKEPTGPSGPPQYASPVRVASKKVPDLRVSGETFLGVTLLAIGRAQRPPSCPFGLRGKECHVRDDAVSVIEGVGVTACALLLCRARRCRRLTGKLSALRPRLPPSTSTVP